LETISMKDTMKGAIAVALAGMALTLSGCGNETANASAAATPDPAAMTAASIDQGAPPVPPAPPSEQAPK
jgi:hypothetical protein